MNIPETVFQKYLTQVVENRYAQLSAKELVDMMFKIGIVDNTRCKVLAVREFVNAKLKTGEKKVDAMWCAAEQFCCSYEYVRKCMYYYNDVNIV